MCQVQIQTNRALIGLQKHIATVFFDKCNLQDEKNTYLATIFYDEQVMQIRKAVIYNATVSHDKRVM